MMDVISYYITMIVWMNDDSMDEWWDDSMVNNEDNEWSYDDMVGIEWRQWWIVFVTDDRDDGRW